MKHLGIIGTGTKAAIWYYETIQKIAHQGLEPNKNFPVKLLGIPFEPINQILPVQIKKAGELMIPHFEEMEHSNCEKYILANITLHEGLEVNRETFTPSDRFVDLSVIFQNKLEASVKKVMIIGSAYTMTHSYLPDLILSLHPDIKIVRSLPETQEKMDEIRKIFYDGEDRELAKKYFTHLKTEYPNVDQFIIACTEHALALDCLPDHSKFFNLPYLQCETLIEKA